MGRSVSPPISPNPDVNEARKLGIEFIEKYNKTPHVATKDDKEWFWQDLELLVDTDVAWEYVEPRVKVLSDMYPFAITEWITDFYSYMPEMFHYKLDGVGQIDWNIFFTLAYPLPKGMAISFHFLMKKLNVAQNRIVRRQIIDEIWNNKDLRLKVMRWEPIPSIYTYYIAYPTIRRRIEERAHKELGTKRTEARSDMEIGRANHDKQMRELFKMVESAQKEGKEVVLISK